MEMFRWKNIFMHEWKTKGKKICVNLWRSLKWINLLLSIKTIFKFSCMNKNNNNHHTSMNSWLFTAQLVSDKITWIARIWRTKNNSRNEKVSYFSSLRKAVVHAMKRKYTHRYEIWNEGDCERHDNCWTYIYLFSTYIFICLFSWNMIQTSLIN